jgi:hypothetical protein
MPAGRPKGSPNKYPNFSKVQDELSKHGFDWVKEYIKLYGQATTDIQRDLLCDLAPYLFPKRKPEDGAGDASVQPLVAVTVTDEQLKKLVSEAREE